MAQPPDRLANLFAAAGTVIGPLLRSPLHGVVRGQLMLLNDTGGRSGRRYRFPIGYFTRSNGEVLSFSGRRWPFALVKAHDIELPIRRTSFSATANVVSDPEEKAALLAEFARSKDPRTARRLMLGLPGDRLLMTEAVTKTATATTIVFFGLGAPDKRSSPRSAKHNDMNKEKR